MKKVKSGPPQKALPTETAKPLEPSLQPKDSELFEVEKDVDGAFVGVGLEPVADAVVVNGQVVKNAFAVSFKTQQILFEGGFVHNLARL